MSCEVHAPVSKRLDGSHPAPIAKCLALRKLHQQRWKPLRRSYDGSSLLSFRSSDLPGRKVVNTNRPRLHQQQAEQTADFKPLRQSDRLEAEQNNTQLCYLASTRQQCDKTLFLEGS